jgi:hypothetical protein
MACADVVTNIVRLAIAINLIILLLQKNTGHIKQGTSAPVRYLQLGGRKV